MSGPAPTRYGTTPSSVPGSDEDPIPTVSKAQIKETWTGRTVTNNKTDNLELYSFLSYLWRLFVPGTDSLVKVYIQVAGKEEPETVYVSQQEIRDLTNKHLQDAQQDTTRPEVAASQMVTTKQITTDVAIQTIKRYFSTNSRDTDL